VVVPNEYGLGPGQKLTIGSKIAADLISKILMDFASMQAGIGSLFFFFHRAWRLGLGRQGLCG
jgi:hypothetical protein